MSKISGKIKKIWNRFADKDYRDEFVADSIDDALAVQIFSMRESRGWTQQELAEKYGTQQTGVCRWENESPPQSLSSLKKIAATFDVALVVKFVPFSEFLVGDKHPIDRPVVSFADDQLEAISVDPIPGLRTTALPSSMSVRGFDASQTRLIFDDAVGSEPPVTIQ